MVTGMSDGSNSKLLQKISRFWVELLNFCVGVSFTIILTQNSVYHLIERKRNGYTIVYI